MNNVPVYQLTNWYICIFWHIMNGMAELLHVNLYWGIADETVVEAYRSLYG